MHGYQRPSASHLARRRSALKMDFIKKPVNWARTLADKLDGLEANYRRDSLQQAELA